MPLTHSQGILLKRISYSESSLILKAYTRESGMVSLIAKGAKRPKSQFAGLLDLFTEYEFIYRIKNREGINYLSNASITYDFENIRTDLNKMSLGSVYLEIYLKYLQEHETSIPLYETLIGALEELESGCHQAAEFPLYSCEFLLQFCSIMGFQPQFINCAHCGVKNSQTFSIFDLEMGGPVCKSCETRCRISEKNIHPEIFRWLAGLTEFGVYTSTIAPLKMFRGESMLISFLRIQTGKPEQLKSLKFYRDIFIAPINIMRS